MFKNLFFVLPIVSISACSVSPTMPEEAAYMFEYIRQAGDVCVNKSMTRDLKLTRLAIRNAEANLTQSFNQAELTSLSAAVNGARPTSSIGAQDCRNVEKRGADLQALIDDQAARTAQQQARAQSRPRTQTVIVQPAPVYTPMPAPVVTPLHTGGRTTTYCRQVGSMVLCN